MHRQRKPHSQEPAHHSELARRRRQTRPDRPPGRHPGLSEPDTVGGTCGQTVQVPRPAGHLYRRRGRTCSPASGKGPAARRGGPSRQPALSQRGNLDLRERRQAAAGRNAGHVSGTRPGTADRLLRERRLCRRPPQRAVHGGLSGTQAHRRRDSAGRRGRRAGPGHARARASPVFSCWVEQRSPMHSE